MAIRHNGIFVVMPELAIIDSWPLLVADDRRGPAIDAVSRGLTTGARLLMTLAESCNPPGAADMRELFGLLEVGCRSELELWGHTSVFNDRSLPMALLQHSVRTAIGTFILDRAYLDEMVGVELDGAAFHGSKVQRERDVRRDAALAREGWLIVRFTHDRLRREPEKCREELRQILIERRRQLGIGATA
jgi:very-short-patch-repair endonuclease